MNIIFLILIVVFVSMQNVMAKEYHKRTRGGALLLSLISAFFALMVFVVSYLTKGVGSFEFSAQTFGYALLFAISYGCAAAGNVFAVKTGPLSLSSLFVSFSLLIPTFWGIVALNEKIGRFFYIGLILLVVSIVMSNAGDKAGGEKISFKWIIFVLLSFFGNGICTVTQKMQQINQNGMYKDEFMIVALSLVCAGLAILTVIFEREYLKEIKKGLICGGASGIFNGITNILVISLALTVPASLMFPVISGGGIALTAGLALTVYREKLSKKQILGVLAGIASIVLLNL